MKREVLYYFTGKLLSAELSVQHRQEIIQTLSSGEFPWSQWIGLTDHHLVMQAIFPKIRDNKLQEYFPKNILEHLKHIFDLSSARNLEIIKQAENITKVLNSSGITPLYMKGVGNILDGVYKYPGERILHDIDILVNEDQLERTADVLLKDGYNSSIKYSDSYRKNNRHYPILFKTGEPVYVELHWIPAGKSHTKYFNTKSIIGKSKRPDTLPGCLVMSHEHKMIHNFIHAQFDHKARIYGREYMRNIYDLLMLSAQTDPEQVFADYGHYRRASSAYLDILYDTFEIKPERRLKPFFFLHFYRFRHRLNLRSRFVAVASFFIIRIFMGYIVNPVKGITNKELRRKMLAKMGNPAWYKKQFLYYKRVFGIGGEKK